MRKHKNVFAIVMSILLLISPMNLTVFADDGENSDETDERTEVNQIPEDSDWTGAIHGNVGTNNFDYDSFEITEDDNGDVTMRVTGNRGQIASGDEAFVYYFQEVDPDANFEISATAKVESMVTDNNQTAFGIMLRSNAVEEHNRYPFEMDSFTGDYVALGGLRQEVRGFHKLHDDGYVYPDELAFDDVVVGEEYDISIRKVGDIFELTVDGETEVIDDYEGEINYAGLIAVRNATVTYSDVNFSVEGQIDLGDWEFSAFGENASIDSDPVRNPDPIENEDGSVTIDASGGKIASDNEGISFYYKDIPADANFEINTIATVERYTGASQVSFGLMLRDEVGEHGDGSTQTANYIAVGGDREDMRGYYNHDGVPSRQQLDAFSHPSTGEEYELSIQKSGDTYVVTSNGESETVTLEDLFTDEVSAGLFVSRDAKVTFSDFEINVDTRTVEELQVNTDGMQSEYLIGEQLNLDGISVTALFSDGGETEISADDVIVTGFDSSELGTNTITLNYSGVSTTFDVEIVDLTVTDLSIRYFPANTEYFIGDKFDPQGLVVIAEYNDGFDSGELSSDVYSFEIDGEPVEEDYVFTSPGTKTVSILADNSAEGVVATFEVEVADAELTEVEIRTTPAKEQYFLGDELDLSGMVVYAIYDDGSEVRLVPDQYDVSDLDTETAGDKDVVITHKGVEAILTLNVKERELETLFVSEFPTTTFYVGDEFSAEGLEVSKLYDNEDVELFSEDDYEVNSDAFDNTQTGTYDIEIVPDSSDIDPISFAVTVREEAVNEFDFIVFGQSIGENRNSYSVTEEGAIRLEAFEGENAGKITGDHDGIVFYYTEIDAEADNFELSADIHVEHYAKTPHDGQESFGIMARDAIGEPWDSSVFSSNIAAVGGFSGGTGNANGTQLFVRTGVMSPDGEGSEGRTSRMLKEERPSIENTYPEETYHLTLSKTNSGFVGKLDDGENVYEDIIFEPEILNVQDDTMYVGFYVAREATIEVSNYELTVTDAETDAPRVDPPAEAISPNFNVLSLDKTPLTNYDLKVQSNADGVVTVRQGTEVILRDETVEQGEIFIVPTSLDANSDTNFSISFLPDDTQYLTSYERIIRNFTVTNRILRDGTEDIYVSPEGTSAATGAYDDELDIDTAIDYVMPGQTIVVKDGHYLREDALRIRTYNDGTPDAMKYLVAEPGARPVFDFDNRHHGMLHQGDYWHVKGLDFARAGGNRKGYHIGGNHNIVENSRFYENGDSGIQISRLDGANNIEDWPSHNLLLNNVSFDNQDPAENNADGFAIKLTVGEGNKLIGNVAHNNVDDGYDLYAKLGTGPIGTVIFKDNLAFDNGTLTDGTIGGGDKNGFKMGGEGIHVPHEIHNSVAWNNGNTGFTNNSNPGLIVKGDNFAYNNNTNLGLNVYTGVTHDFTLEDFVSIQTEEGSSSDSYPSDLASDSNYLYDGTQTVNVSGEEIDYTNHTGYKTMNKVLALIEEETDENGDTNWTNVWDRYYASEYPVEADLEVDGDTVTISNDSIDTVGRDGVLTINVQDLNVSTFSFTVEQIEMLQEKNVSVQLARPGLQARVPAAVLTEDITINEVEDLSNTPTPDYSDLVSSVYEFSLTGNFENDPVLLEFEVDTENVSNPDNLRVFYYNSNTNEWKEKDGGTFSNGVFSYPATHFSMYTVMEVNEAEILRRELEQQINDLRDQIEDLEASHSAELASLTAQLQQLENAYANLELENEDLEDRVSELENDLRELQEAFDELAASLEEGDDSPSDDNGDTSNGGDDQSKEDDDDVKGDDSSKDDEDSKDGEGDSSKGTDEEDELPDTATNMYNFLLIGLALIIVGLAFYFYRGRREKELV
ncbi:bacterial Ig-like domain-containing protein [Evansella sp. AB-P1]|uniref:bacterial Ig-like domain-containing protein n=1 Tax=Evansella sp. AB-P1 TaxID=3037653 RepID=UPI00241C0DF2|nr:bacterial Ig-like domain-containing protein [Evansella sp. AB-P1]MDG5787247.1 bacterial Ig-like domain-containing protein [Evansella sp. AB-P1]